MKVLRAFLEGITSGGDAFKTGERVGKFIGKLSHKPDNDEVHPWGVRNMQQYKLEKTKQARRIRDKLVKKNVKKVTSQGANELEQDYTAQGTAYNYNVGGAQGRMAAEIDRIKKNEHREKLLTLFNNLFEGQSFGDDPVKTGERVKSFFQKLGYDRKARDKALTKLRNRPAYFGGQVDRIADKIEKRALKNVSKKREQYKNDPKEPKYRREFASQAKEAFYKSADKRPKNIEPKKKDSYETRPKDANESIINNIANIFGS